MSNFVELIIVVGLVACGAAFYFVRQLTRLNPNTKAKLDACDYIIFEASSGQLPDTRADLQTKHWRLAGSELSESGGMLYRFEKIDGQSASLSEIFEFEKSMPRTASRTIDPEIPIKIRAHGASGLHA